MSHLSLTADAPGDTRKDQAMTLLGFSSFQRATISIVGALVLATLAVTAAVAPAEAALLAASIR